MTPIPTADAAEAVVVAVCLETRHGLGHVADVVRAQDFWNPLLRRVFAVLPALEDVAPLPNPVVDSTSVRVAAASVLADVSIEYLRQIVNGPVPVMFDARRWALEVAEAARRRRVMSALARAHAAVAEGVELKGLTDLVVSAGEELAFGSRSLEWHLPELSALLQPAA